MICREQRLRLSSTSMKESSLNFISFQPPVSNPAMSATSETDKTLSLPSAPAKNVSPALTVQPPLSRAGKGPALIILVDQDAAKNVPTDSIEPRPLQKWAEESFLVAQIDLRELQYSFEATLEKTVSVIKGHPDFYGNEKFGVICSLYMPTPLLSISKY